MKRFRDLSIRTKLTVTILAITILCLSIGFTALGLQRVQAFRADMRETATLIATVVGEYSVTDLAFGDRDEAAKTLQRLRLHPDIESAALYDAGRNLFATYVKKGAQLDVQPPARVAFPGGARNEFRDGHLETQVPIVYEGTLYGLIHLRSSTASVGARIRAYFLTVAALLGVLLVLTVLVAGAVQRVISRPILELAGAAEKIASGAPPPVRPAPDSHDEIGTLARGFNTMVDNLERRQLELRESSETLRALIQACPLAIIAVDRELRVTLWNSEAERMFAVGEEAAVGQPIDQLLRVPGGERLWAACRGGQAMTGLELTCPGRGDAPRELAFVSVPLHADGLQQGSMLLAEDVTERKQTQAALHEREVQLQRMQKMEAVGRLAGGVSHDFNNLLTIIIISAKLLARRVGDEPSLQREVDAILATAERGTALTRRLLAFSAQKIVKPEVVDLNGIIADVERMLRRVIGEDIKLETELSPVSCHVLADPGQMEQVLLNLAINARDAMPRGGRLEIRTEVVRADDPRRRPGTPRPVLAADEADGWVRLTVGDTGCGMSPEVSGRVFEPFFTTKPHGTGLGLATVHGIVTQCSGRVSVESDLGAGTTFHVWLPRRLSGLTAAPEPPPEPPARRAARILLVEDEPRLREAARQILEAEGYGVVAAQDGVDALSRYQACGGRVDLLLTDVVMPEMSGPRLAQELLRRHPHLPVLYMSGYLGSALTSHGLDDASFPILGKPFAPEDLIQKVAEILEQAAAGARQTGAV